jgi:Glycosyl hydrolases family 2, TIM barrel domain/Glycosyl hydrolases family 2, sugar binding domain/Glycosyl hydrolases family 2
LVSLPHTWNIEDVDFIGNGWYFKTFSAPSDWRLRHIELHFGATFYKSRVWLNGVLVGGHEGGYSEYYLDLTKYLGNTNFLAVEINNQPKVDTIPGADLKADPQGRIYDWWPYGGIVRDAWLTVGEGAVIRWQHIDSHPAGDAAEVLDRISVENVTTRDDVFRVRVSITTVNGSTPIASAETEVRAHPGVQSVAVTLKIPHVQLWGIDTPFLYRSDATVRARDGRTLDDIVDNFGVRTLEIRDRHLYLNREQVRLTGLARHQDSPWEGLAETRGTMLHVYSDLKDLQSTLTRPVHYQQHPLIYDFADQNGILMIPEIPMWQFSEAQMSDPRVVALAERLLRELIEQNYNHPSIFAWSMDNESATNTPGGISYFKTMYAVSKQLDPGRYVSFADDLIAFVDPATNASRLADFIMWNEYFGSWDGPESLLPAAIEKIDRGYPDKMVLVTEFGYPGVFAKDPESADKERVCLIRGQLPLLAKQDWIAGALQWCYQDYHSSHNLRPGQSDHWVDHGVVDKNRQRKPSYYVWERENAPAHVSLEWNYDQKGRPIGFHATISRRSEQEMPSYLLINYRAEWRLIDADQKQVTNGNEKLAAMGPAQPLDASWGPQKTTALRLELLLYRPTGYLAASRSLTARQWC